MMRSAPRLHAVPVPWTLAAGLLLMAVAPGEAQAAVAAPSADAAQPEVAAAADCRVRCGLVLGMTSFTVATGSVVTWARITGGLQSPTQGQAIWAISFGASLATAATLYGPRRERAVYAAGLGAAAGAVLGFTVDAVAGRGERSTKIAATLIGAALGAVAGGAYGAFSQEEEGAGAALAAQRIPLVDIRIPF